MKVPPVVLMLVAAAFAWLLARLAPFGAISKLVALVATLLCVAMGAVFLFSALLSFRKRGTTVDPMNPQNAQSLVVGGLYRVTRNQMYVGFSWFLGAWCFYLGYPGAFIVLPLFVFAMTHLQIKPEERALKIKFGIDYANYMRRVRRWL